MHSPLLGLTVTWDDQWRAEEIDQENGTVSVDLVGDHGYVRLWAAPAFGGDGSQCIDEVEDGLESDTRVSPTSSEQVRPPSLALPTAPASGRWRMDFQNEGAASRRSLELCGLVHHAPAGILHPPGRVGWRNRPSSTRRSRPRPASTS